MGAHPRVDTNVTVTRFVDNIRGLIESLVGRYGHLRAHASALTQLQQAIYWADDDAESRRRRKILKAGEATLMYCLIVALMLLHSFVSLFRLVVYL